jgi:hypothetical protein
VGIFLVQIFFQWKKCGGLDPPLVDHWRHWSTMNRGHGQPKSSLELGLAAALGHGSLLQEGGKRRGRHNATGELLTRAWTVVRRRRIGGGASAQNSDGTHAIEGRRSRTKSVGCFTGDGGCFL